MRLVNDEEVRPPEECAAEVRLQEEQADMNEHLREKRKEEVRSPEDHIGKEEEEVSQTFNSVNLC